MIVEALFALGLMLVSGLVAIWAMYFLVTKEFFAPFIISLARKHWYAPALVGGLVVIYLAIAYAPKIITGHNSGAPVTQTGVEDFSLWGMIQKMKLPAVVVAIVLATMSMYSIAVMVERWLTLNKARRQSRHFATNVSAALVENRIDDAIAISENQKESPLAEVVKAGLNEFEAHQARSDEPEYTLEAARRALHRATALKTAEMKRGLYGLATIGSTAPFVGLFGTVIGIVGAFQGMKAAEGTGIAAVAGGISEALIETAFGLLVAIPAVWAFNIFTNKVEAFTIEIDKSSSELIDYLHDEQIVETESTPPRSST